MSESAKEISKNSKSSFYYAFNLLPEEKRDAMNTVYAFCRKTDDIVDENSDSTDLKFEKLRKWRIEFEKSFSGHSEFSLLNKLGTTISKFNIPLDPFFELIKGMEMDLQKDRYKSFEDLQLYCYRVASTVGLMCIEIFGYKHPSTKQFAVDLGIALQMTNILRDIGKDAKNGRIYLPQEDLIKFNYSEQEILSLVYNNNFKDLMIYESARAKQYFNSATAHLDLDDKKTMFAARAMQHIYYKMLENIIAADYDVYNNDIKVSKFEKVGIALGVWAKYNLVY
ncbi:MAG: presqualene diphosphate synthase HpnD [Ignavibacteriaceae bacterium]|nr:presqualene diphosphate synthase HpnD [Ignavibacterium sp.]MCC6255490.1 presqualene diphosphate synthase HpnD [Ignavibacteriaceae bacterium]HMN25373.1 presqualene diphosphate synthase HpnD [Ignavibacteriaceae bacterium]HRN25982.1 presqualene diphosphate synthase HpnD [Ignavibacteriaceae bacterium]HRP93940.1 presqualene diphosphate synthase HpnD [Ignavibacteriaceae bacterium]